MGNEVGLGLGDDINRSRIPEFCGRDIEEAADAYRLVIVGAVEQED